MGDDNATRRNSNQIVGLPRANGETKGITIEGRLVASEKVSKSDKRQALHSTSHPHGRSRRDGARALDGKGVAPAGALGELRSGQIRSGESF